jgi:hypothetical protein
MAATASVQPFAVEKDFYLTRLISALDQEFVQGSGCGLAAVRAAHTVTSSARWESELPRCSGGNGGNPMSSLTESEHADQS